LIINNIINIIKKTFLIKIVLIIHTYITVQLIMINNNINNNNINNNNINNNNINNNYMDYNMNININIYMIYI